MANFIFDTDFRTIVAPEENCFLITDNNVFLAHADKFKSFKTIIIKAGEQYKNQETVDEIIARLIVAKADRKSTIIGVGGGVVTDIAGYVAAIFMRGLRCVLVPTSILAMSDAAIGGKNGIDVGIYKNMIGTIRQPENIIYDFTFLHTLPKEQWINGFSEIIKHAVIADEALFFVLENHNIVSYKKDFEATKKLIMRNAELKYSITSKDTNESGIRKILNYGHTLGHAIEYENQLPHGFAISVGMNFANLLSKEILHFSEREKVNVLINQYELPTTVNFDKQKAIANMGADKKRSSDSIDFILIEKIGKAVIKSIPITTIEKALDHF